MALVTGKFTPGDGYKLPHDFWKTTITEENEYKKLLMEAQYGIEEHAPEDPIDDWTKKWIKKNE